MIPVSLFYVQARAQIRCKDFSHLREARDIFHPLEYVKACYTGGSQGYLGVKRCSNDQLNTVKTKTYRKSFNEDDPDSYRASS